MRPAVTPMAQATEQGMAQGQRRVLAKRTRARRRSNTRPPVRRNVQIPRRLTNPAMPLQCV